ncbi:hypothetical protein OAE57_02040 [Synechococcus sp. AH-551-C10]|nr:hypothetical protein [Synechococcus sp. AH-551-C10]MDB4659832.1 hypothetical protein [Synechococcus sp. AH-551-C10]
MPTRKITPPPLESRRLRQGLSPRGDVVIGSVGGVGQTIASDPFITLLAGVSLALRNR